MMNTNYLFETLNGIKPLSLEFRAYLSTRLLPYEFNSGNYMPYRPPVSQTIYFIASGTVAGIGTGDQKKRILWFSTEGKFICPGIMRSGKQFTEEIEFLTSTLLIGIEVSAIMDAVGLFPGALEVLLGIIDRNIAEANERELFLRLNTADRYQQILKTPPRILFQSHAEQIASYLNISKRALMRIKRNSLNKRKNP